MYIYIEREKERKKRRKKQKYFLSLFISNFKNFDLKNSRTFR